MKYNEKRFYNNVGERKSPSLNFWEGDGYSLALFFFLNRKQVSVPVEYKSTKTTSRRELTCHLRMIVET